MEKQRRIDETKRTENFEAIDLIKYIASILIIVVHTAPFLPYSPMANYIISDVLARIAVPFFFVSTSFFIRKKMTNDPSYFKKYLKSLAKLYLFWSMIYLPIGMSWIAMNTELPLYLYPLALVAALVYVGMYYHLWYIPALLFALIIVNWFLKHFRYKYLIVISLILYLIGCLETYYGILQPNIILTAFDQYLQVFVTTRNGLFYGIMFVVVGFILSDYEKQVATFSYYHGLIVSTILLITEAIFLYNIKRLDMNFLIMLVPFIFFFFQFIKESKLPFAFNARKYRELSKYYYLTHGIFLFIYPLIFWSLGFEPSWRDQGVVRFTLVFISTHFLSILIIFAKNNQRIKDNKLK